MDVWLSVENMPKGCIKIAGFSVFLSIVMATLCADPNFALAKRSLVEKEKAFFKSQPMSEELSDFIQQYRKRRQGRTKRSGEIDENLLYVIQNGQLVPFKDLKESRKKKEDDKKYEHKGYTVVPLVIPINNLIRTEDFGKITKARALMDDIRKIEARDDKAALVEQSSTSAVIILEEKTTNNSNSTPHEAVPEASNEDENNKTKEETAVLVKILHDVEGLMTQTHSGGNKKEGALCNLQGSWISEAAGMRFDITFTNSTRKKFKIHVADRIPPNEDGFLCDGNWTVFGELPFKHSGVIIALAVHAKDKHIATFIGECRVCEGSETVTGTWLIGRSSRDCKDQKASHKILSDVWRREQGHTLRKKHLLELGITEKEDD